MPELRTETIVLAVRGDVPTGSVSGPLGLPQEASAFRYSLLHLRAYLGVSHVGRELGAPRGRWLRHWWPGELGYPWRLGQEP